MNEPLPPDPYKALGVDPSTDAAAIKTAYRKLVLRCHPDKFPDPTMKAVKQEEFQRVQQAWEILGSDDNRQNYDLQVRAKKLKDEVNRKGSTTGGAYGSRYVNVNVRTAEPPAGWNPSKHAQSKSSSHKPYSGLFSQSWENEIPSRSKAYQEEGRTARRAASYEKPRREDSRERRRRVDEERERERRREQDDEEDMKRERERRKREIRDREREREAKEREREREREREKVARKARERDEQRLREREEERRKAEKKMRERERETKRKQEAEEKARAKAKPYVEHSGFSDDEDDARKSPAKKASKKHGDSPTREKPSSKQRDRTGSREEVPTDQLTNDKLQSAMAYAAQYVQETKNKAKPSPKPSPESYSAAYPDPNEKFAAKRRGSGDGKHGKGEPVIVDVPGPSPKDRSDAFNPSSAQQGPPRLQKSYTMPAGYVPQAQGPKAPPPAPPLPPRGHPSRSYTMQPDHFDARQGGGEKHRSSRRRASFDEENSHDYFDDRHSHQQPPPPQSRVRKYSVNKNGAAPRVLEAKYKDPYAQGQPAGGTNFSKVKMAPSYGPEHVSTAKRYQNDEVLTSDYGPASYADYHNPTQAAY